MKDQRDEFEAEGRSRGLVVFSLVRESRCLECSKELWRGDFLFKDGERALCMTCADLDELVYLPSGDAALSRRAKMHSPLSAVVVRFSRARKRYERQGILVSKVASNKPKRNAWQTANYALCVVSAMRSDAPNMIAISSLK